MAQISSLGAFSDPSAHLPIGTTKTSTEGRTSSATKPAGTTTSATDETEASPLQSQLTRLSAVLNGLQTGATVNRTQYVDSLNQVRAGTYEVDSAAVSRSIVDDALGYS